MDNYLKYLIGTKKNIIVSSGVFECPKVGYGTHRRIDGTTETGVKWSPSFVFLRGEAIKTANEKFFLNSVSSGGIFHPVKVLCSTHNKKKDDMNKDRIVNFRIPEAVYVELQAMKERTGAKSLTGLIVESLLAQSWSLELERNREYHRHVLKALDEVEKRMKKTDKPKEKVRKSIDSAESAKPKKAARLNGSTKKVKVTDS